MPAKRKTETPSPSATPTNEPRPPLPAGTPAPAPAANGATPAAPAPFDLARYRTGPAKAPGEEGADDETSQPPKPRGPKVKFGDLAGLDGFRCRDAFEGDNDEFGHYAAVTIVAPDGATAIAMSNERQGPGKALLREIAKGTFDDPTTLVPIHVRKIPSTVNTDPQTGKPFMRVMVRFGSA